MLEGIFVIWFLFVILSLIYLAFSLKELPVSWVQKLGWLLVVAYSGPVGLFFYFLTCRSPGKGLHDVYTRAHWKQAVNSEVHCVAGDATGIIVAAIILSFFTISNGLELLIEYIAAFIFGWFIFQAGMMASMYKNYWQAVTKTFFAETTSMNMVMVGMIPTMVILKHYIPNAGEPAHAAFWFVMGMATIVGGVTAYPINSWLVGSKLKHGCMTLPEKAETAESGAHAMHHHDTEASHQEHKTHKDHEGSCGAGHGHHGGHQHHSGHEHHGGDDHAGHAMGSISLSKQVGIIIGTFVLLAVVVALTSLVAPISL